MNMEVLTSINKLMLIITHNDTSVNKCISVCSNIDYPLLTVKTNKDLINTVVIDCFTVKNHLYTLSNTGEKLSKTMDPTSHTGGFMCVKSLHNRCLTCSFKGIRLK